MFTIVDANNRFENADLLDALYWARYDAFVLGRGWHDLARPDGRDIDQFDDEDTVYIIGQEAGRVVAGCRIRPSDKPHLLQEAFSHLVSGNRIPQGANIFECSRLFVERRHPDRMRVFLQLLLTTVDWYRTAGGDTLTGVIESWWLNSFLSLGFNIVPLGAPDRQGRNSIVAVRVVIDHALQENLRRRLDCAVEEFLPTNAQTGAPAHQLEDASDGKKAA